MKLLDAGFWILLMNVENNYYLFITLLFISTAFVYHLQTEPPTADLTAKIKCR